MDLPCGTYNVSYEKDSAILRTNWQWALLIGFLILLFLIPLFSNNQVLSLLIIIAMSVIAAHGLNILTGLCGQLSVGHAAFVGVGAYASGILATKVGMPFWFALPCAGIIAGLAGVVFGAPALRIKGFYLALATLGAQFIIIYIIGHLSDLTGGYLGMRDIPSPKLGGMVFDTDFKYCYLAMSLAIVMTYFAKNIQRSRIGRAFIAIRDNELAAEVMGVSLFYYKLLAFFIGCFFAGIAGSVWAHYLTALHPEHFALMESIWYVGIIIVGGMGSTLGVILGTVVIRGLSSLMTFVSPLIGEAIPALGYTILASTVPIAFGVIIILFLVFEPRGLAHRWQILKASYRLWPFSF